jgi:hypothetical protein
MRVIKGDIGAIRKAPGMGIFVASVAVSRKCYEGADQEEVFHLLLEAVPIGPFRAYIN